MRYHYRVTAITTNYHRPQSGIVWCLDRLFLAGESLESVLFYGPPNGGLGGQKRHIPLTNCRKSGSE
jgi:hypothetical protein